MGVEKLSPKKNDFLWLFWYEYYKYSVCTFAQSFNEVLILVFNKFLFEGFDEEIKADNKDKDGKKDKKKEDKKDRIKDHIKERKKDKGDVKEENKDDKKDDENNKEDSGKSEEKKPGKGIQRKKSDAAAKAKQGKSILL